MIAIHKFASAATGAGLGRNIADCYEAVLRHWRPGDRIYLVGFSRGAYTARCLAGVLRLCGVPTRAPGAGPMPCAGMALRAIADEAVHQVYEHGAGRDRTTYEKQRLELAARFRRKYGAVDASPYFIGVFDTVAALGTTGLRRVLMVVALALGAAVPALAAAWLLDALGVATFDRALPIAFAAVAGVVGMWLARARLKVITRYPTPGRLSWHWSGWRFGFYDTHLDSSVPFARAALAIDETRRDFRYVPWGQPSQGPRPRTPGHPEPFVQLWFAGNHSDIGGSYPEDESRLSDIALQWMVEQMAALPCPVIFDRSRLRTFPDATGRQHCEVESTLDAYPRWWPQSLRRGWKVGVRMAASGAVHHPTVAERFAAGDVVQCAAVGPYRPKALSRDPTYASRYPAAAEDDA